MDDSEPELTTRPSTQRSPAYWVLLGVNYACMFSGSVASSLLTRFYFIHQGSSRWVATWVQSSGFPILLIPMYMSWCLSPRGGRRPRPFGLLMTRRMMLVCAGVGLLTGVSNFLISWGISYLSVSTSSLLLSCQLAFNLVLSAAIVKQRLTFSNVNCVVLLTLSSVLLAVGSSHDRPSGVTRAQFFLGFASILGAALLFALYLPIMEKVYRRVEDYLMVMEMQVAIQLVATAFSTAGMGAGGGFGEMKREGEAAFDLGGARYWVTIGFTLITWQMSFLGTAGIVYLTTSLTGGICMTALLPMNVVGGVLAFGDAFSGDKAVSTALCLWGFLSYVYGQYKKANESSPPRERDGKHSEMVGNAYPNGNHNVFVAVT